MVDPSKYFENYMCKYDIIKQDWILTMLGIGKEEIYNTGIKS